MSAIFALSEDENYIYIKNLKIQLIISISKINAQIILLNEQTSKVILINNENLFYGIMGIINICSIPCLILIEKALDCTRKLEQFFIIKKLKYYILNKETNIKIKEEIEKKFNSFSQSIINSSIYFSNILDLSTSQNSINNIIYKDINYLYNVDMLQAFFEDINHKLQYFYSKCIQGYISFFKSILNGQDFLFYFISKKNLYIKDNEIYKNKIIFTLSNGDKYSLTFLTSYNHNLSNKFNYITQHLLNIKSNIFLSDNLDLFEDQIKEENLTLEVNEKSKDIPFDYLYNINYNYKKSNNYFTPSFYNGKNSKQKNNCIIVTSGYEEMISILKIFIIQNILLCFKNYEVEENTSYNFFNQEKSKKLTNKELIKSINFEEQLNKIISNYNNILKKKESKDLFDEEKIPEITKFDQINHSIFNSNNLTIYILTFNLAAHNDFTNFNLENLLFPKKYIEYFSNDFSPDFYCIGLQEIVELNISNIIFKSNFSIVKTITEKISTILFTKFGYQLIYKQTMVGLLFLFYVKSPLIPFISEIIDSNCKTGFIGLSGNKGYCMLQFCYNNKYFCFTTGHFCAGESKENFNQRKNELTSILTSNISSSKKPKYNSNDYYFIFGDLNFRIEINKNQISKSDSIEKDELFEKKDILISLDELNNLLDQIKTLNEGKIGFFPTYKYIKNTNKYNLQKRCPAWTDRILYGNSKGNNITQIFYDDIDIKISDHRPVSSLFQIDLNL
jgi:hypothetical protein